MAENLWGYSVSRRKRSERPHLPTIKEPLRDKSLEKHCQHCPVQAFESQSGLLHPGVTLRSFDGFGDLLVVPMAAHFFRVLVRVMAFDSAKFGLGQVFVPILPGALADPTMTALRLPLSAPRWLFFWPTADPLEAPCCCVTRFVDCWRPCRSCWAFQC